MKHVIEAATGLRLRGSAQPLATGGGFASAERWESDAGPLFVKLASVDRLGALEAEAAGLGELASAHAIRVPRMLGVGVSEACACLVLEWIDFGPTSSRTEARLGERLAAQHRRSAHAYGWHRDNTIGATPQPNPWTTDWPVFYAQHRLGYQLDLAERGGHARLAEQGRRLIERVGCFFTAYRPEPALLHGDLWGGNWAADGSGEPVIFDPAVYYGDREADLAMTRLFGGFGPTFYAAYAAAWPPDPGARERSALYNLYHVLNHLNLFGGGYAGQAARVIEGLLSATAG
jgi:fructosamine-3-kinase